jgi:hypothetical protein
VSKHKLPSQAVLRKAASKLGAPTNDMLLDLDMLKATRNVRLLFGKQRVSQKQITSALASIGKAGMPQQFLDFKFTPSLTVSQVSSISKALSGIYEPVDTVDLLVPSYRRYKYPTLTHSSNFGGGYANNKTGQLQTVQSVNLGATTESTFVAFYGEVDTGGNSFWQSGVITFQAVINWRAYHSFSSNFVWNKRLDGYVWLYSAAWLVMWVYNPSSGQFERLPGISSTRIPLYSSTWYVNENGAESGSGTVGQALATLQFTITNPPQIYLVGVACQGTANHNIRNVDGNPLPASGDDFIVYTLTSLDVPYMFVSS